MKWSNVQDGEMRIETQLISIHSALANSDSLRIFNLTEGGIDASTSALSKYNFTKKRYYGRLKELVDLGLVFKDHGEYRHTPLGSKVFATQVKELENLLSLKSHELPPENKFSNTRYPHLQEVIEGAKGSRFFASWTEFASELANSIRQAQSEICLAVKYLDARLVESLLDASKSHCWVKMIQTPVAQTLPNSLPPKFDDVGSRAGKLVGELLTRSNVILSELNIEYSFAVLDQSEVFVELPSQTTLGATFFGFYFHSLEAGSKLISYHTEISKTSKKVGAGEQFPNSEPAFVAAPAPKAL